MSSPMLTSLPQRVRSFYSSFVLQSAQAAEGRPVPGGRTDPDRIGPGHPLWKGRHTIVDAQPGARPAPPFRVEHIGSFVRPPSLLESARNAAAGLIAADAYRAAQDRAIEDIVRLQESLGLGSITDGEFRRRGWSAGFIDAVGGFGIRDDGVLR